MSVSQDLYPLLQHVLFLSHDTDTGGASFDNVWQNSPVPGIPSTLAESLFCDYDMPRLVSEASRRGVANRKTPKTADGGRGCMVSDLNSSLHSLAERLGLIRTIYECHARDPVFASWCQFNPAIYPVVRGQALPPLTEIESIVSDGGAVCVLAVVSGVEREDIGGVDRLTCMLETPNASLRADITDAQLMSDGYVVEGSVVLVQGTLVHNSTVFLAKYIALPPTEPRVPGRAHVMKEGIIDSFGGLSDPVTSAHLTDITDLGVNSFSDTTTFVLSDVVLDTQAGRERLESLFDRLVDAPMIPTVLVLCGNYLSPSTSPVWLRLGEYKEAFTWLAGLFSRFVDISNSSHVVFVPGPDDATLSGDVLPRGPLPPAVSTDMLKEVLARCTMAHNPCRLRVLHREIVIHRDHTLASLRRHIIMDPHTPGARVGGASTSPEDTGMEVDEDEAQGTAELLCNTLLSQATLNPLPPRCRAVVGQYHHAMSLYPLPHVVVLADALPQFQRKINYPPEDTSCENTTSIVSPGSFANGHFLVIFTDAPESCSLSEI
ncbi:hypothetical protein KIPB_000610 [Kipferlia bialata]|uniref:DNA polymerase II subunit 2 n=1 Tax=Kipferlia bialata TaxID=797122 RepID=A0A9K3GEJ2_9EUKA|nr:hypothetical protein KIPB_000610 [Kipferlia bialata]|eukprot:g610.t1